jgi:phosphoserine phosphatase
MTIIDWQLKDPVSAIVFDCDGTLSAIEGIDELARNNSAYDEVKLLTEKAMSETGINPEVYRKRLDFVIPHQAQLHMLAQTYFKHCTLDAKEVIAILNRLNKSIYIVSAGLNPAVTLFGELLQIRKENIYAVNLQFDQQGNYLNFDHTSPLIERDGKRIIINALKQQHEHIIHIGDGLNDYVTHDIVTRFIGYGGIYYRKHLSSLCNYYIHTQSLSPLLPLSLTQDEYETLLPSEQALYLKGLTTIQDS